MASNYARLRAENERRYGTDIGRIGEMLLANLYDDRTHFIYELLQNAEDALDHRGTWNGKRSVHFELSPGLLRVSHYGKPFDEADVRAICGIAESTKDLTAIGHFGIGFKSVYAFSKRPEVHSAGEDFAIENFVWPVSANVAPHLADETLLLLPLHHPSDQAEIEAGLKRIGVESLLFLRNVEEIEWKVADGSSGIYLRSKPEDLGGGVRRITVIGQRAGAPDVEQSWLIFSKPVHAVDGGAARYVEVAFNLDRNPETGRDSIRRIDQSPLVAFFPTALETGLGFLVQGPYRTTPSRDNVPAREPWNVQLIKQTAELVVEALGVLKSQGTLDVGTLSCMPLDSRKYPDGSMFAPLFKAVREALSTRALLPMDGGGWTAAGDARLARTRELRELFDSRQLGALLGASHEVHWLTGDITRDTTPILREYLIYQLNITELTPELVLPRLSLAFLEAQSDAWIVQLYEFLGGHPAVLRQRKVADLPFVRLEDGLHVRAIINGQPQAFLPSALKSGFPTVRRSVCSTKQAQDFLCTLGLTEPDSVDDVVRNLLPGYAGETVEVEDKEYAVDVEHILAAYNTDLRGQRDKLLAALRESRFVMSVDLGDGQHDISKPGDLYVATERLTALLGGVKGAMVVDNAYACLRGTAIRDLLEACGASRTLAPEPIDCGLTRAERAEIRREMNCEHMTSEGPIEDHTLRGLPGVLKLLPTLNPDARRVRAELLWDALRDVVDRRGANAFAVMYRWQYYRPYEAKIKASYLRALNDTAWIPDNSGGLQRPSEVVFKTLGWKADSFLLSQIEFKPPVIEQLAHEAGIEPGMIELLRQRGITTEAELLAIIGLDLKRAQPDDDGAEVAGAGGGEVDEALVQLGIEGAPSAPEVDPSTGGTEGQCTHGDGHPTDTRTRSGNGSRTRDREPHQTFVSYVGVHPDEDGSDPDGLEHAARMALEAKAIELIRTREPAWLTTPPNNPGFDLFQVGEGGQPARWCEVKAMTGCLDDHPVGMTHTEFDHARRRRGAYWLYVVEHVGTEGARIVRIQDPAGKAETFTFDHGWRSVAEIDSETNVSEG